MSDNTYTTDSTEIEVASGDAIIEAIASLQSGADVSLWSSFAGGDEETADAIFGAVTDSIPVAENLNKTINIVNVIVQRVELTNEETGELSSQPRITFVDAEGVAYNVTSPIVLRDVKTLFALRGQPSQWSKPYAARFVRGGSGTRQFITMKPATQVRAK